MKKLAAEEKSASSLSGISISKDNLRKDWARHKKRTIDRKSNLRLAIIIAILVGLAAYFFEIHKLI
ncbi:hypothetical protein [Namhaeicola litoreus]|uniref:Uncharacterized protein n=1 Tax=Namhaeicola litoreus TaxID=1052145 RepID=A0ABW3Y369_9FLAO